MALLKFVLFSGRFLAFLWLKVAKKHGMSEICAVFWVGFFGISLAQGSKETWCVQNSCCFLGRFLAFLWLKVAKKHGMSEICAVFWVGFFGISLAQGSKETWHVQNSYLPGYSNFILWVSSLAGVVNWK